MNEITISLMPQMAKTGRFRSFNAEFISCAAMFHIKKAVIFIVFHMSKHFLLFIKENEEKSSHRETYFVNSLLILVLLEVIF